MPIRHFRSFLLASCVLLLDSSAQGEHSLPNPPTPQEIDQQYASALSAMKHPLATGVLVTEIGPNSPAGAAGLRAGDIIIKLHGNDVRTLAALRQEVADLIASNLVRDNEDTVVLAVRREPAAAATAPAASPTSQPAAETVYLQIPREPLGIRAIEVEAGQPAPLNPPISVRGTITLDWDHLRHLQNNPGAPSDLGQEAFLRITHESGDDVAWLGWQKRTADPVSDDELAATLDVYHVAVDEKAAAVASTESIAFRLRTGDYKDSPAFLLLSAEVTTNNSETIVKTSAARAGEILKVETETTFRQRIIGPVKSQRTTPLNAIIPAAIPLVALAMPQQKDAVIPIQLMSTRDFVARPGYVLAARGKQNLPDKTAPAAAAPQAWRVDLLHCGVLIESYWLSDNRKLLRTDSFPGTPLTSRRVPSEQEARVTLLPKPTSQPATRPSTNFTN